LVKEPDLAEELPEPVPLRSGSRFRVYPVPVDYFVRRIEGGDCFYFTKINHGLWERYLDVRRQEAAGIENAASVSAAFVLEGSFKQELEADLKAIPRTRSFIFGVSHIAYEGHEGIAGQRDGAEIVEVIESMLPPGYVPVDGTVWKQACINGEVRRLWEVLSDKDVVVVGPEYLSDLDERLDFRSFRLEAIHRTRAHEDREQILERLLRYEGTAEHPVVLLMQSGSLSLWLARRMFDRLPHTFMVDLGIALNLWLPDRSRPRNFHWERYFMREIREHLGIELAQGGQRRARRLIEDYTGGVRPSLRTAPARRPISYIDNKPPDFEFLSAALRGSESQNQWSNFGPASLALEDAVAAYLELPDDRRVVACASGTAALFGLVNLREHLAGRALQWGVSDFGFFCTRQGPLAEAVVLDCLPGTGMLSRRVLRKADLAGVDGLVVTNVFGLFCKQTRAVVEFCAEQGLHVIVDSAGGFDFPRGDAFLPDTWEALSFHHTKPWGMGEGGAVILPAELEDTFRSIINFGLYMDIDTGPVSFNGKLSDLAAAAIMQRLHGLPALSALFKAQHRRIARVADGIGLRLLNPRWGERRAELATPAGVALVAEKPIPAAALDNDEVVLRKYYRPLVGLPGAQKLYEHILVFPCHPGVAAISEDTVESVLSQVLAQAG
jgi:dTDP-4-amino-4,6-dideoxygalactose transaminase